jgi:Protein of unknown function (DUF3304)
MFLFKRMLRLWLIALVWGLTACNAMGGGKQEGEGVGLTGIDHLADHLSVQNFWVNGHWGAQAGKGGRLVCCAIVPKKWTPGLKAHVQWRETNWKEQTGEEHQADVPIDRYDEVGRMFVHFLANGEVRITLANESPHSPTYPGTHDPIPQKEPWKVYPRPRRVNPNNPFNDPNDNQQ